MSDIFTSFSDFLAKPATQIVILLAALATMIAVGIFVVRKFRDRAGDAGPTTSDLMSNFGELHSQGELSDQEYRTIKTMLASRMQQELKDTGKKG